MKKQAFLHKLAREGKLQIVDLSSDIKEAYLEKSESYLTSAKILLDNERLEETISITYYSMYYSALALLFACGIKSENHTATMIILHDVFGLDNSDIQKAKRERIDKQYYFDFEVSKSDAERLIKTAQRSNAKIYDFIQKLTSDDLDIFQRKLKELT